MFLYPASRLSSIPWATARLPESRELRRAYRSREEAALASLRRFVELGQAAGKLRHDDPEAMASALLVVTQGLNNPLALACREGHPLFDELTLAIERLLAPVGP